jgi:hypothetical protein
VAFQCLQLVVTDFLPVMPWRCLPLCVDTAAKFGSQTQELNISLTAVGLMVSDQKRSLVETENLFSALSTLDWFLSLFKSRTNSKTMNMHWLHFLNWRLIGLKSFAYTG